MLHELLVMLLLESLVFKKQLVLQFTLALTSVFKVYLDLQNRLGSRAQF